MTCTVSCCVTAPPAPVHVRPKLFVAVSAPVDSVPCAALAPAHPSLALQPVAFVVDQVSVDDEPEVTLVGDAVKDTVGAGATVTFAAADDVPPAPVQSSPNVVVACSGPTVAVPVVAFAPDQPPVAVHVVAFVACHDRVEVAPAATCVGDAVSVTTGACCAVATVTVVLAAPEPPGPVQVSVNVAVADSGPTDSDPLVAFAPDQPPPAVQVVASVADHVSVDDP